MTRSIAQLRHAVIGHDHDAQAIHQVEPACAADQITQHPVEIGRQPAVTSAESGPCAWPAVSTSLKYSVMNAGCRSTGNASHSSTCATRAAFGIPSSYGLQIRRSQAANRRLRPGPEHRRRSTALKHGRVPQRLASPPPRGLCSLRGHREPLRKSGLHDHVRDDAVALGVQARHERVVIRKCFGRKRRNQAVCSDAPRGESAADAEPPRDRCNPIASHRMR